MVDIDEIIGYVSAGSVALTVLMTLLCCCRGYCVVCCRACCGCRCKCCGDLPNTENPNAVITDKGNGVKEYHIEKP